MGDAQRDVRAKDRAILRRNSIMAKIHQIHALAIRSATYHAIQSQLAVAIVDLDTLWSSFVVENNDLLNLYSELDLLGEFSIDLELETLALVVEAEAVCNEYKPTSVVSIGAVQLAYEGPVDNSSCYVESFKDLPVPHAYTALAPSRLPEIPLKYFDGEYQN